MRKTLLAILGLLAAQLLAAAGIESGKKYYLVSAAYNTGSMGLGAYHDALPLIYYNLSSALSDDSYWIFEQKDGGYAIRNAASGLYLQYTTERDEVTCKYMNLSATADSPETTWALSASEDGEQYAFQNIGKPAAWINVRLDGSCLVGTYSAHTTSSANEYFFIYDDEGNLVTENGATGESPENCGMNEAGEYWANSARLAAQPVVLTENVADPVLYTITNVRSGLSVSLANSYLRQRDLKDATRFYFTQATGGVNIYTEDNQYVATSWYSTTTPIYTGGSSSDKSKNRWSFGYYADADYPGYTIERQTDRSTWGWGWGYETDNYHFWNSYEGGSDPYIGLYSNRDSGNTFLFASADVRHLEYLTDAGFEFENVQITASSVKSCVDSLTFDEKDIIYDQTARKYYMPLPEELRGGKDYTANVRLKMRKAYAEEYYLTINGQRVNEATKIDFSEVSCLTPYLMEIRRSDNDEVAASTTLNFTFLPIVEISYGSCNYTTYTTGSIRVTDANYAGYDSTFVAAYRYRGATASGKPKKAYAIKLRDEWGNSVDREFLGLREDNNWILDAAYIDPTCIRNRVSTDLWNDFSHDPYHKSEEKKARTGTRGAFVEVFLNGTYHGLYCMTEKMDRKQLKLKKFVEETDSTKAYVRGSLYKSTDWSYEVFFGHEMDRAAYYYKGTTGTIPDSSYPYYTKRETWRGYEGKYPDYEEEFLDWGPLYEAINLVATGSDDDFINNYYTLFDYPVVNDYYLFIELLLATDNHGKNMYYFNYDQTAQKNARKLGIAVWDLDGVWGIRWDGSKQWSGGNASADQDFTTFLWQNEHGQLTYFTRLREILYMNWENQLKDRYNKLRETYFDREALKKRFRDYAELFAESGADTREGSKWASAHGKIQSSVDYACEWIDQRIATLDAQYGYIEPTGTGAVKAEDSRTYFGVSGGKGQIAIHSPQPQTLPIYNMSGRLVRTVCTVQSLTVVDGFQPGIYVVGGKKVIVQ